MHRGARSRKRGIDADTRYRGWRDCLDTRQLLRVSHHSRQSPASYFLRLAERPARFMAAFGWKCRNNLRDHLGCHRPGRGRTSGSWPCLVKIGQLGTRLAAAILVLLKLQLLATTTRQRYVQRCIRRFALQESVLTCNKSERCVGASCKSERNERRTGLRRMYIGFDSRRKLRGIKTSRP